MNRTPRWLCWLAAITALLALAVQVQGGTLTLRQVKGSAITNAEYDGNFVESYSAAAHGFSVGTLVYKSGASTWAKAIATASSTYADGVVVAVPDANTAYISVHFGQPFTKTAHGLGSAGTAVYLSDSVAGNATASVTDQLIGQVLDANTIIFGVMGSGSGGGETGSYSGAGNPLKTFDSTGGTGYKKIISFERDGVALFDCTLSNDNGDPFSPTCSFYNSTGATATLDWGCDRTTDTCWVGQDKTGEVLNLYGPDGATIDLGSLVTVAPRLELNGTCLDDDSDRLFGDKDCDGVKDAGEEYLDLTGGSTNSFETIDAPSGTDPVADSSTDTLAITAADGLAITGTAGTDTLAFTLTLAGDVDGSGSANDLDEAAVESELEGVLDLQDLQGAVTDAQVPDTITASNYLLLAGGTVTGTINLDSGTEGNLRYPTSTTLPATCTVGDSYWDTDADTDGSLYVCKSTDTWKEVDDDGGAGSGDVTDVGDCTSGSCFTGGADGGNSLQFEGSSADGNETTLTAENPTADNTITLPNSSGTVLTTGNSWTTVMKLADESLQNDASINDDNTLFFAMAANTKYAYRGKIVYTTNATPDFKFRLNGPASPTLVAYWLDCQLSSGACTDIGVNQNSYPAEVAVGTTATFGQFWFDGVVTNGTNTGNFVWQWSQNTSDNNATVVKAGSYIEWKLAQ